MDRHFFGYGSLVNRLTHDHAPAHPARVTGWRREWRATGRRRLAFLSVRPDPGCEIEGLVAEVPGGDWAALDRREAGYDRVLLAPAQLAAPVTDGVAVYVIPPDPVPRDLAEHPILLSYLDVVVQGFLAEFGPAGVARFFETTDGWQAPVLDDRARPMYPRAQRLTEAARDMVDGNLHRLGVRRLAE
ncbi:MAG: gamma-glutamylcyclotransferase [Rhodobacteraceae bacterium]|nr:gamma-glutamylcyclotransferase [Paracoccaceae bacterium]